jgi:flavodoxin I
MIGYTSQEGYQHKSSKASRGESFCGLLLDAVNEEELTEERVKNWVAKLRDEGILETSGKAEPAAAKPAAPSPPKIDVFEDQALAEEIISEVKKSRSGYMAHYNPRTDKTMWVSTDGRSSYVTAGAPGYE